VKKLRLGFTFNEHLFIALQGFFLFGINYWLVYKAELFLPSGLVSVVFSTIIFLNVINGSIFLGSPIRIRVIIGAVIGIVGIGLVFYDEIIHFNFSSGNSFAFLLAMIGVFLASFGNILSARNQAHHLPVIQTNAFGMIYGAIIMFILALVFKKSFIFDFSFSYISSMLYLVIFGSVIAFSTYLILLGRIGADRAAYVTLIFPIIALILSTIFEGYLWTITAVAGVFLILSGNFIILQKKKSKSR
jgi:drug/metabolite transporter (DMT)-like permease